MRNYTLSVTSHGFRAVPNTPEAVRASHAKVGEIAVVWFRRIFGRPADRLVWFKKGFMAEARDRRGNAVLVQQTNFDHLPGFDSKTGRFPLSPYLLNSEYQPQPSNPYHEQD